MLMSAATVQFPLLESTDLKLANPVCSLGLLVLPDIKLLVLQASFKTNIFYYLWLPGRHRSILADSDLLTFSLPVWTTAEHESVSP